MPMNLIIQEKRKELGLTQEEVAQFLNVSAPAVSKWEKGITCPDISLLPSLARLLKTDLNALFCFREDLTLEEISLFCKEIIQTAQTDGILSAFDTAVQKMQEYPHNETLLHYMALNLDGLLSMSCLPEENTQAMEKQIVFWYQRLAQSSDPKISNIAKYMLVSRHIRKEEYAVAQEILDTMPDRNDILNAMADKQMLQVTIYQEQGMAEKAAEELERALLMAVNKVQLILYKLVDAELAAGKVASAKYIADRTRQVAENLDLWNYSALLAPFQVALQEQNADDCIFLLKKMLESLGAPWKMQDSPFFARIAGTDHQTDPKQIIQAVLAALKKDPRCSFLQDNAEYQAFIRAY